MPNSTSFIHEARLCMGFFRRWPYFVTKSLSLFDESLLADGYARDGHDLRSSRGRFSTAYTVTGCAWS